MYIINGVHGPETRSSGGNTSFNRHVSALIPRPAFNGMERMCQRHRSNQNCHPPVLVRKQLCNLYIATWLNQVDVNISCDMRTAIFDICLTNILIGLSLRVPSFAFIWFTKHNIQTCMITPIRRKGSGGECWGVSRLKIKLPYYQYNNSNTIGNTDFSSGFKIEQSISHQIHNLHDIAIAYSNCVQSFSRYHNKSGCLVWGLIDVVNYKCVS